MGSFSPSLSMIRLLGLGSINLLTSMRYVQSIVYPFCIVLSSLSFFVFGIDEVIIGLEKRIKSLEEHVNELEKKE